MLRSQVIAMIKEISAPQAWDILNTDKNAVLLDVRTKMEFDYVGHPLGAIHVPWQEAPTWEINPGFVNKVREVLKEARPSAGPAENLKVITLCRSGKRSYAAGQALADHGFKNVMNIKEGFEGEMDKNKHRGNINGWRFHKLPWEQS